ncbi:MAG: SUMF1/EgtB/PvdO family nonheme iron enzyme [Bacteroidota bacterium]
MPKVLIFVLILLSLASKTEAQIIDTLSLKLDEKVEIDFHWLDSLNIWVGKYEVTNEQYNKFMRFRDGSNINGLDLSNDLQPAVFVSYCDAVGFCYWLNNNTKIPEGFHARLPSKSEWDFMVKDGEESNTNMNLNWPPVKGNFLDETANKELGWDWHIKDYDDGFSVSAPVNLTLKNKLGLFGIRDNVREWTSEEGKDSNWRIIRGASWRDSSQKQLTWDYKVAGAIWGKDNHIGFRVVIAKKPEIGN